MLEDLGNGDILSSDIIFLKLSSPLTKEYILDNNEEKFGQNLYKVTLECNTIKQRFCYIKTPTSKFRTRIISVDHELNDIQVLIKNNIKNETEKLNNNFYILRDKIESMNLDYPYLDLSNLQEIKYSLNNSLYSIEPDLINLNNLYFNQEYSNLGTEIYIINNSLFNLNILFENLNFSLFSNISAYNSLIDNITFMREEIFYLEDYNFSEYSVYYAESFISNFNEMILEIKRKGNIEDKIELFENVSLEKENLFYIINNESVNNVLRENLVGVSIYPANFNKILIEPKDYLYSFNLEEPFPICCLNDYCYNCIDDSSLNYPIILVHGHSFNERLSAELSMESFSEMARALEREGYLDAGYFYVSKYEEDSKGYLGRVNTSIVVEATYYIDTSVIDENSFIFDSKWESINTYASRLNEVISNVKYLTGKDKVIVVAHSMGGLVSRRYVQLYGEESLDKLILVGIPNKGVDGFVLNYCSVFGADLECSEMNKSSLFLAELNNAPLPDIPIYNLVGLGCFWEGSDGDGIVKNSSAYLEGAENIYVNGTCNVVDFFHVRMIKPNLHPEIYEIVKDLIEEK